jgi:hypothetical protein
MIRTDNNQAVESVRIDWIRDHKQYDFFIYFFGAMLIFLMVLVRENFEFYVFLLCDIDAFSTWSSCC